MTAAAESGRPVRPDGLRERKKLATREALGSAAMRLALERGLENVLVDDIATAAGVSPRTFNNYFTSKYEAICALSLDRSFRIGEALLARPADEELWDAIKAAVLDVYGVASTAPDPKAQARIRLVTSSPELRGEYLKMMAIMQRELAAAITDRINAGSTGPDEAGTDEAGTDEAGTDRPEPGFRRICGDEYSPGQDDAFFTRALSGAVTSVVQAATERWLFADPPAPLAKLVSDAMDQLAAGMFAALSDARLALDQPENDEPSPARAASVAEAASPR